MGGTICLDVVSRLDGQHVFRSVKALQVYMATSLMRNCPPIGSYSRIMPEALRRFWGRAHFLMSEVPLFFVDTLVGCRARAHPHIPNHQPSTSNPTNELQGYLAHKKHPRAGGGRDTPTAHPPPPLPRRPRQLPARCGRPRPFHNKGPFH